MVSARRELRCLLELVVPSALSTYCFFAISITELSVVGHLGVDELAAVAYAQMCLDLSILVSMQGFNAGMNVLCSQAFGAKNYHLLGEYALLTSLLLTVACVPLAVLWWNLGDILLAAGVTDRVAALAGVYCRLSLLWLWPRSMFQVLSCFYQAQHIVQPTAVFNVLAVALNSFLVVGFTHGRFGLPELGFVGCPIGTAMALFLRLVGYIVYMNFYRKFHRRCAWRCDGSFLDADILRNLLSVGLPLAGGTLFENAQLITMTLFAATIGEVQLGTHNAMMELFFFATSPLYAVISAAVTRVGMHLGAGKPSEALLAAQVCGICIALISTINGVVVVSARRQLGWLFSDNPQVIDTFSQICALAALAYFVLAFFYYSFAVLKAQARPMPIMVGFAVGAWLVGVPVAYILGVHQTHPNLLGVWHGMICGYAVTSFIGFAVAFGRPNWRTEADRAVARSHFKEKELAAPHESDVLLA
ncbi:MATE efflux family protein DTX1 [Phytophthora nicotianae]|uniref:MATE efflux family protein DTX1 n=1 Tax=Phytophthora nicotianae TaxID=4792 RepID=A0A0W8C6G5_PHYNI|nr:MATE efflux family protein DTX1 [Phytophthora nicotianae]